MHTLLLSASLLLSPATADTTRLAEAVVTTYTYDESGRVSHASAGADVSFSYDYDAGGNPVSIMATANQAPGAFFRVQPEDSARVSTDSLRFSWTRSIDPEGAAVTYELTLDLADFDTTLTTADTSAVVVLSGLAAAEFSARWSVVSSDGQFDTKPQNGEGYFVVDRSDHVASDPGVAVPHDFALLPNYPNPFNPSTTIRFDVPVASHVELAIFDILGRRVATLLRASLAPGVHTATWDGRISGGAEAPSGVYFYLLTTRDFRQALPMLLSR